MKSKNQLYAQKLIKCSVITVLLSIINSSYAGEVGSCLDAAAGESAGWSNCTAGDIGVNFVRVLAMKDGCVSSLDTATVNLEMSVTASVSRYDIGVFLDLNGGDARVGSSCVHEVLFDTGTPLNLTSGIGPFRDTDSDLCGDMDAGETWTRNVVDGDIPSGSIALLDVVISCSDLGNPDANPAEPPNGYVDLGWAVSWRQNQQDACNVIADNFPGTKSKCNSDRTDTNTIDNPIPIGVPEMGVTLTCTPTALNIGDTTTCTAEYINSSPLGAADYLKFKVNYPDSEGSITSAITQSNAGETTVDGGAGIIDWTMTNGQVPANILANTTESVTFDYTYTGGADFQISIDTYFDNTSDPEADQSISASQAFTTLPVTVSYVYPQISGNELSIDFSTASETYNIGFNIYAVSGKVWSKLNDNIIPGALDSFAPRDYHVELNIPSDRVINHIGIAGVTANGQEDRHGLFKVNHESGSKIEITLVDWVKTRNQLRNASSKLQTAAVSQLTNPSPKFNPKTTVVNLEVSEGSVYRVTHDDLMAAGVSLLNRRVEKIAISLRGEGVPRYISGASTKGRWSDSSIIEFTGVAPQGSSALYLSENRYQLSLSEALVIESDPLPASSLKVKTFESNNLYSYSLPTEDPFYDDIAYAFGENLKDISRDFTLPVLPAEGTTKLKLDISAYSQSSHHLLISLNGEQIADERSEGWKDWPIEITVENTAFNVGENQLVLSVPNDGNELDYIVYDKLVVSYSDGEMTEPMTPVITLTDSISKKSLELNNGTNYVIISHPAFIGEPLNNYIEQRKSEGWKITLIDVEDIYVAYGFSMATPDAIETYLAKVKDQGVTHIQLIGAANYDYHDYLGLGSISFIPSIYTHTGGIIHFTPCDACFVFNEQELPSMAIGRWPVRSIEELETIINKSLAWEKSGQSASHSALFIADQVDKSIDFRQQMDSTALLFQQDGWEDLTFVYLDDIIDESGSDIDLAVSKARENIANSLSQGASITSYSGHSSTSLWSFSGLLKQSDIDAIDNVDRTTIALPLACFSTYADSPYIDTMAHQMLAAGENGAVAVYGAATTSTYADNGAAADKIIINLLEGETLGESIKKTKQALGVTYRDIIRNSNLIGDVTIRLH